MGLYIEDVNKYSWLRTNGTQITQEEALKYDVRQLRRLENKCIVCLVDNTMFFAAAVAFSNKERDVFAVEDGRDKEWYLVPISKAKPKCDKGLWEGYWCEGS